MAKLKPRAKLHRLEIELVLKAPLHTDAIDKSLANFAAVVVCIRAVKLGTLLPARAEAAERVGGSQANVIMIGELRRPRGRTEVAVALVRHRLVLACALVARRGENMCSLMD